MDYPIKSSEKRHGSLTDYERVDPLMEKDSYRDRRTSFSQCPGVTANLGDGRPLHPFTSVKNPHLAKEFVSRIARAVRGKG